LEGECKEQDTEEEFVVEELLENIEISFSNFSTVDVVEDLEENEGVKDPGEMLKFCLAIIVSFNFQFISICVTSWILFSFIIGIL